MSLRLNVTIDGRVSIEPIQPTINDIKRQVEETQAPPICGDCLVPITQCGCKP